MVALLSVLPAIDFREGNNESEDAELRFVTCQSLWNQIKSETEVSLAPQTKAVIWIYNDAACFFVSDGVFISPCLKEQLAKKIKRPEILTETVQNVK